MRRYIVNLAASFSLVTLMATAPAAATDAAIRQVIGAQIEAFEADDFSAAFEHASPAIRRMFATPERFGSMVQQGYPMVHRPAGVRFLEAQERGAAVLQRVLITDEEGRLHLLEYEMIDADGRYLINGVRLLRGVDEGV